MVTATCPRPVGDRTRPPRRSPPSRVHQGAVDGRGVLHDQRKGTTPSRRGGTWPAIDQTQTTIRIKIDWTAPTVVCGTASGGEIWPPNHKMVLWNTSVLVTDLVAGSAGFKLTAFSSSEALNWKGDGNTNVDMTGWTIGTPDVSGYVRAERPGPAPAATTACATKARTWRAT